MWQILIRVHLLLGIRRKESTLLFDQQRRARLHEPFSNISGTNVKGLPIRHVGCDESCGADLPPVKNHHIGVFEMMKKKGNDVFYSYPPLSRYDCVKMSFISQRTLSLST